MKGCMDVTRRYVRDSENQLPRERAPEFVVESALESARISARSFLSEGDVQRLKEEDNVESSELNSFLAKPHPTESLPARETGDAEWKAARGEDGA